MTVAENAAAIEALEERMNAMETRQQPDQLISQLQATIDSYALQIHQLTVRVQELESGKATNG